MLERLQSGRAAGVVLFARNLGTPDEIDRLTRSILTVSPKLPPVISIDQEGGRVQRVKAPFPHWPPMARLGERGDEKLTEEVGRAFGREVAALGFNVDFAPVLDVHTNPQNPIIGDRAFGTEPKSATAQALAFWRGLESAGVRGCGKHFPGHGDTATDSHLELPIVRKSERELREIELPPFVAAAKAKVPMIMTAHVVYPSVDEKPATLSSRWLTDILRKEIGFDGVIVSDDFDMKALAGRWPVEETIVQSLLAGADAFLLCRDPEVQARAEAALESAAAKDAKVRARVEESAARLERFRRSLVVPPPAGEWRALPLDAHQSLADRFRV